MKTIALLVVSNLFMTVAWYGHLKHRNAPLIFAIISSWLIAFFEYVFQVPANRLGYSQFTLTQLKVMQECITLIVFTLFAVVAFKESIKWNNLVSYLFIVGAVYFCLSLRVVRLVLRIRRPPRSDITLGELVFNHLLANA